MPLHRWKLMTEEPERPGLVDDNIHSMAWGLYQGHATTRDNIERIHVDTEQTFVASEDRELGNGASLALHLNNPPSSNRTAYFYHGEMTHQDNVQATLHTKVDSVTVDTELDPSNNYVGSSVTSVIDVETAESFNTTNDHFSQMYVGSGSETIFNGYKITLPPDESIILELENLGGSNGVGIRFAWAESAILDE